MAQRSVRCVKLGIDLPGLAAPPFPGELGRRIFEGVSQRAWALWQEEATGLMHSQGLSMATAEHRKLLLKRMEEFLFTPAPSVGGAGPEAGTVFCVKVGRRLPALEKPPFPGELGRRIFENVSQQGWELWEGQATIVMNHYNLSLADPEARRFLMTQMEEFFFGEGARLPADWTPPAAEGKGGGGKGAPAPRNK